MKEYRMSEPKLFQKLIEVFGSISSITGKKILVIRDLEVALMLSIHNAVVYITDDEDCAEAFRKNTEAGMGDDDIVLRVNNWNKKLKFSKVFEKMEKKVGKKKFDVVIMNPPYDRNLHLKILETVIPCAEKVINISPVRWLQDPFAPYLSRSDYNKFEESVSKHIKDLEIIPAKEASELFQEASFTMNLGIYTCDSEGGRKYRHDDPLVNKIVEKTMESSWKQFTYLKNYQLPQKQYVMNVSGFGGSATMGFDYVTCKTYKSQLRAPAPKLTSHNACNAYLFSFDSEIERIHFFSCYLTKFMRWMYRLWKSDVNIGAEKVPYFGDYKSPWTNEKFKEYFGITDEEWTRIEQEMTEMNL